MYYLKGFGTFVKGAEFIIIENSINHHYCHDLNIPIGPNKEWLNQKKIGTRIKMFLVLDKNGSYLLSSIFKKEVKLTHHNMYAQELIITVDELPPIDYLGCRVSIKIEAEQKVMVPHLPIAPDIPIIKPISPDESSGVPMCSESFCKQWRKNRDSNGSWCVCRADSDQTAHDDEICLPRVRKMGEELAEARQKLDEINQRRCDGCSKSGHLEPKVTVLWPKVTVLWCSSHGCSVSPGESCSRWDRAL